MRVASIKEAFSAVEILKEISY